MSDLTKEELEATRKLKAINKVIASEEKIADELFDELGYKKMSCIDNEICISYANGKGKRFLFSKPTQRIMLVGKYKFVDMKELKAINKKVEELGWLE